MNIFDEGEKLGGLIVVFIIIIAFAVIIFKSVNNFNSETFNSDSSQSYTYEMLMPESKLYHYINISKVDSCADFMNVYVNDIVFEKYIRTSKDYIEYSWYCKDKTINLSIDSSIPMTYILEGFTLDIKV
jgi:hypothetical protein